MELNEILSNLCYYDKRNPNNDLEQLELSDAELALKRKDCSCDNCFYNRTQLAEEILRLRDQLKIK